MDNDNSCNIKQPTVLIVDDQKSSLNAFIDILGDHYDVLLSKSGQIALDMLEDEKVDLILLDIMMPHMDGFEVCEHIKFNPKLKDIPVLFITSNISNDVIEKAYTIGCVDVITKPFIPIMLKKKIEIILENSTAVKLDLKDNLTGVRDRYNFLKNADIKFKEQEPDLRAVTIDIDDLESINKVYSSNYGDDVIKETVKAIREVICTNSVFGRTDANGFTIVCSLPTEEAVKYSIKFIKDSIQEKTISTPKTNIKWTVSIGVATRDKNMEDVEDMINRSLEALREAKSSGKDRIVYL